MRTLVVLAVLVVAAVAVALVPSRESHDRGRVRDAALAAAAAADSGVITRAQAARVVARVAHGL